LVAEATGGNNPNVVITALLHDAIEDQKIPRDLIAREFGEDVAATLDNRGVFGGVEAGYNWQVGIETDFNASNINRQGTTAAIVQSAPAPTFPASTLTRQNVQWFGTVRPRVGWLATDALLLYGTGGLAYGKVNDSVNLSFCRRCGQEDLPTSTISTSTGNAGPEQSRMTVW
jgi:opacity protein-like surface antigen